MSSTGIRALVGPGADLEDAIWTGQLAPLSQRVATAGETVEPDDLTFLPLLARPRKIICLGLNFAELYCQDVARRERQFQAQPMFVRIYA